MTFVPNHGDDLRWPDHLVDASDVRGWIASVLPGHPHVDGPTSVLHVKTRGVVARFALRPPDAQPTTSLITNTSPRPTTSFEDGQDVVFKASYLPLYAYTPFVYALLKRCCAADVPHLLAWDAAPGRMWMLFRPFEGVRVRELQRLEPLLDVARTLARIQVAVAAAPEAETVGIARLPVGDIPVLFDEVLQDIHNTHFRVWTADDGAMAHRLNLPIDALGRLLRFRGRVAAWAAELAGGGWPDSIDHTDLHTGNAAVQADGRVLIYDWEEATIGSPFFSLEQLLDNARALDEEGGPARDQGVNPCAQRSSAAAVRRAYLDALPWKTYGQRERALELAGYLWPIKDAMICKADMLALGQERRWSELTGVDMARALRRWEAR